MGHPARHHHHQQWRSHRQSVAASETSLSGPGELKNLFDRFVGPGVLKNLFDRFARSRGAEEPV